jgi:hypothetical protein
MTVNVQFPFQICLVSEDRLGAMTSMEKVRMILDQVKGGDILVLEQGLSPQEYSTLMEMTMTEIRASNFPGIEIGSYPYKTQAGFLQKLLRLPAKNGGRLTLIGRSDRLRTLQRDRDYIAMGLVAPPGDGKEAKAADGKRRKAPAAAAEAAPGAPAAPDG